MNINNKIRDLLHEDDKKAFDDVDDIISQIYDLSTKSYNTWDEIKDLIGEVISYKDSDINEFEKIIADAISPIITGRQNYFDEFLDYLPTMISSLDGVDITPMIKDIFIAIKNTSLTYVFSARLNKCIPYVSLIDNDVLYHCCYRLLTHSRIGKEGHFNKKTFMDLLSRLKKDDIDKFEELIFFHDNKHNIFSLFFTIVQYKQIDLLLFFIQLNNNDIPQYPKDETNGESKQLYDAGDKVVNRIIYYSENDDGVEFLNIHKKILQILIKYGFDIKKMDGIDQIYRDNYSSFIKNKQGVMYIFDLLKKSGYVNKTNDYSDNLETDFNIIDYSSPSDKNRLINSYKNPKNNLRNSFLKWYWYPKRNAEKYNKEVGLVMHSGRDIYELIMKRRVEDVEMCVSTLDANKPFRYDQILIGRGNMRLLYDFDCYSYVGTNGYRYATAQGNEYAKLGVSDLKTKNKTERVKVGIGEEHIGEEYYDEGFVFPKDVDWLLVSGVEIDDAYKSDDFHPIVELIKRGHIKYIPTDILSKALVDNRLDIIYKYIEGNDMNTYNDTEDDFFVNPIEKYKGGSEKSDKRGKGKKKPKVFRNYRKDKKYIAEGIGVDLFESFTLYDLDQEDQNALYDIMKKSYDEAVGISWDYEKFMDRARHWEFFGDEKGFIAARQQKSGPYKLVSVAGSKMSILRGFRELNETGKPIWGMVSKDIQDILKKTGYKTPPGIILRQIMKQIPPAVFGGVDVELNKDGSVTIDYPDIGKVVKYFAANGAYYKWAIDNIPGLPMIMKSVLKKFI